TRLSRRRAGAYLLLAIASIVVLVPFLWTLYASFVKQDVDLGTFPGTADAYWTGHYQDILTTSLMGRWWLNSIVVTLTILVGNLALNTMAGYALARVNFPGRKIALGLVLGTMMLPPQVLFEPIYTMVIQFDWLNTYRGLILPFLVNPFGVFLMRQFFVGMPQELDDAASLDGLGPLGVFYRVALPIAWPAIAAQAIFIFVWNWNTFVFPSVLATSPEMFTLPVGIYQITHTTFTNHVAQSMAGVVLATVPALLVFAVLQRRFIETLAGTAKG
ncbi:MAG: carbohydrate ABC transporter permease, partial [Micromonosporaceae bacterium]